MGADHGWKRHLLRYQEFRMSVRNVRKVCSTRGRTDKLAQQHHAQRSMARAWRHMRRRNPRSRLARKLKPHQGDLTRPP